MSRSTKIVATIGPATSSWDAIDSLITAGIDVARINFSHGNYGDHKRVIETIRHVAERRDRAVAILQDLQGPKIRTGPLQEGPVELRKGASFVISIEPRPGDATGVSTSYTALPYDVEVGSRILLSDGAIELVVRNIEKGRGEIITEVMHPGLLSERQGINLPDTDLSIRGVTEKDERDLAFGLELDVDYVGISFVRSVADVRHVKSLIAQLGRSTPVIAKIEKPEALDDLEAIIDEADGLMVARGDLGVELAPEKVPLAQKRIIEAANRVAKPVITATQMLESMIHSARPTRAEASDVANAILDGTDAVMLSAETATGKHPQAAVLTMDRIAIEMQAALAVARSEGAGWLAGHQDTPSEAIGAAVATIVRSLSGVSAIWVLTRSGLSARVIAHQRPGVPILAFTPDEAVYRRLALIWGVTPMRTSMHHHLAEIEATIVPDAIERGLACPGDTVVLTGSHPFDHSAPTNFLKIQTLPSSSDVS